MIEKNLDEQAVHRSAYVKLLRPLLPEDAFKPDPSKLGILFLNIAILICGWTIARQSVHWPVRFLWLYLPIALMMGNSIIVLLFSSHELMHGSVIRGARWSRAIALFGLAMLWMPPSLWTIIHNRIHHNHTNSSDDPDRNYLYDSPDTWGKTLQDWAVPSSTVTLFGLTTGMATAWGTHAFRNLVSILFFNGKDADHVPAAFTITPKERVAIVGELAVIIGIHASILAYLRFQPIPILSGYFLPIWIGYSGLIFYIYTNHLACPMTSVNDPLLNSLSIRVFPLFDKLHLNFSYHVEHHIFPNLNSDYYPIVRELVRKHYPDRADYVLPAREAWNLLMSTPRFYQDAVTLTDRTGNIVAPCRTLTEKITAPELATVTRPRSPD